MNRNIEEIKELLTLMLQKLESIEIEVKKQEEELKTYIEKQSLEGAFTEVLLGNQKSTKTSIELLRDEIEELHQIMIYRIVPGNN